MRLTRFLPALLAWVFLLCAPVASQAQLMLLGAGGPSGAATPVVLNGVTFGPQVALQYPAATFTNSCMGVNAFLFRGSAGSNTNPGGALGTNWRGHVVTGNVDAVAANAEVMKGYNFTVDNSSASANDRLNLNNATTSTNNSALGNAAGFDAFNYGSAQGGTTPSGPGWHSYVAVWDVCTASAPHGATYIDGTKFITSIVQQGTWSTNLFVALNNDVFQINDATWGPSTTQGASFDIEQFLLDTPTSSPVDSSNNITVPITNFWNNGPVAFGANGSLPLGHQPLVYHQGPASTWATNLGTTGTPAFVMSSPFTTNTFLKKVFDAPIAPGETPTYPYWKWTTWSDFHVACPESTGTCSNTTNNGNAIQQGDLLEFDFVVDNSTTTFAFNFLISGYTSAAELASGANQIYRRVLYKIADAGDVTNSGVEWTAHPTFTWTPHSTDTFPNGKWVLTDWGNVNQTTPVLNPTMAVEAAASGLVCPPITAPAGKSLFRCGHSAFDWSFITAATFFGPPSTSNWRFGPLSPTPPSTNLPTLYDERINSAGTVTRSGQESAQLGSNVTIGYSAIIQGP